MSLSQRHTPGMQPDVRAAGNRVVRVEPDRRMEALERLVSATGESGRELVQRFEVYAQDNRIPLDAMWAVEDPRGRLVRTLLAVPAPGRTAMLFVTRPTRAADVEPTATLVDAAAGQMGVFDVNLAQVLIDPRDTREQQSYAAGGFTKLAELSYLERPIPSPSCAAPPSWPTGVTVEPCVDPHDPQWARTLEQSYEGTQDCPGLLGLRRTEDVIEGHKSVGEFDSALWTLLRVRGEPSGVLLLNPTPTNRSIELVYLGLIPAARGQGLATRLLQYGLTLIAGRDEHVVTLAVDERNAPALRLYRREGFRPMLRRIAYIRSIQTPRRGGAAVV